MSRSRRKTPITGWARVGIGEMKKHRRLWNGQERAAVRNLVQRIRSGDEEAAENIRYQQHPWDEWSSPRDGKMYWARKGVWSDEEQWLKMMRK